MSLSFFCRNRSNSLPRFVKPLDPLEYDRKLAFHQRVTDAREYGLRR